jgi:hypothetical protein
MRVLIVSWVALLVGCAEPAPEAGSKEQEIVWPSKAMRIAVVGAGPSGLMAARTLGSLGYTKVTVFEKNARVGGKVWSLKQAGQVSELGAVFASPDYKLVLGLADQYGIPYVPYGSGQAILDENGQRQTFETFLTSRYSRLQILGATAAYAASLALFVGIHLNGLDHLPADLSLPFDQFAARYGFTPIAELARSVMIGFGYGYYETAPAAYFMKLLPWLVKLGGDKGLTPATYYTFPTGFQSVWEAVAAELDVRLDSEVTSIVREPELFGSRVRLTARGVTEAFDAVIISAPLNRVSRFMQLTPEEQQLFAQVESERYDVSLFTATGLTREEALFFHGNAQPSRIDHVNVWANRDRASPIYIGYQIAQPSTSLAQLDAMVAADVAGQGGQLGAVLLRQDWDYFPHVSPASMRAGFYERMEALQGKHDTFYVGGTLSFETVEHSARYAEELVRKKFLPAVF